jgi:lipopolysaccharide transport system permease protein
LIRRLVRREIEARYRGSLLGLAWAVATPLFMLAVYTFVFSTIFQARWAHTADHKGVFALILFAGMLAFNLVAECLNRAPGLVLENASYVKRVVFPLDTLAWVCVLSAAFTAAMSLVILTVGHLAILGLPPVTSLLLPLLLLPLILTVLGVTWFLSSVGVYVRDIRQFMPILTTALLFLSPIFYPASAVPEGARFLLSMNPLTPTVEGIRAVLFSGQAPNWYQWSIAMLESVIVSWLGFTWFENTRRGFADVL